MRDSKVAEGIEKFPGKRGFLNDRDRNQRGIRFQMGTPEKLERITGVIYSDAFVQGWAELFFLFLRLFADEGRKMRDGLP